MARRREQRPEPHSAPDRGADGETQVCRARAGEAHRNRGQHGARFGEAARQSQAQKDDVESSQVAK
jgi:hypothetical protein